MSERVFGVDEYSTGYRLQLRDGNSLWLTGCNNILPWLDKLAAILELKESPPNGIPKLVFSKMGDLADTRSKLSNGAIRGVSGKWFCHDNHLVRIWNTSDADSIFCEIESEETHRIEYISMWNSLQSIYQRSIGAGGLPIHSALIELNGRGVLLAAPGDTGKSTCCRRLPSRWRMLCDDETLVVLDKHGRFWAHPFPTWSEYLNTNLRNTWDVQYSVPLRGVFFLEKAEVDESIAIGNGQTAFLLTDAATQVCQKFWRRSSKEYQTEFRTRILNNACGVAERVPAFRLRFSLHGGFWEEIEKALEWS